MAVGRVVVDSRDVVVETVAEVAMAANWETVAEVAMVAVAAVVD